MKKAYFLFGFYKPSSLSWNRGRQNGGLHFHSSLGFKANKMPETGSQASAL
jgi:hypothetical protein